MSETLMTEANQTNEGATQQPVDASTEATTETQQQAETVADQQDSDESTVESETSESEQETTKEGAPESYEFNTQVADAPDELDPEVVNAFGDVAKELNLPQDAAQKVLDKVAPVLQRRQAEAVEEAKTEWANEAKADQ